VGDDPGLLKKVTLQVTYEDEIISEPTEPRKKWNKRNANEEAAVELDEIAEEVKGMKEEAVIRRRTQVEMKVAGKTGEQKKDQGILYLRHSL
jgi:hypothetical protein